MGGKKKESRWGLSVKSSATSGSGDQNLARSIGGLTGGHSEPEQSSVEQKPQQVALSPPTTSFTSRLRNSLKWGSSPRSPSPGGKRRSKTPDPPMAAPSSESLAVPARPHSSYSGSSAPLLAAPASVPARSYSSSRLAKA